MTIISANEQNQLSRAHRLVRQSLFTQTRQSKLRGMPKDNNKRMQDENKLMRTLVEVPTAKAILKQVSVLHMAY